MGALLNADGQKFTDAYNSWGLLAVIRATNNVTITWEDVFETAQEHGLGGAIELLEEQFIAIGQTARWINGSGTPLASSDKERYSAEFIELLKFLRTAQRNGTSIEWSL
jgi:hypothetical protein